MTVPFGERKANEVFPDIFSGYDAAGGASVTTAATTIPITGEHLPSSASFDLASGEVQVKLGGTFELAYDITLMGTGSSRSHGEGWLERNGIEVPGTRSCLYCRQANYGATGSMTQIALALAVDDTLRLRAIRTAGSAALPAAANASRLYIKRL